MLSLLLTQSELAHWGWRIPFALGAMTGPIGLWLCGTLEETLVTESSNVIPPHILSVFVRIPAEVLSGILIAAGGTVLHYFFCIVLFSSVNLYIFIHFWPCP